MIMEKNISIDILKFFAVIFITNSHMNYVYGEYGALATGGAIGDVLFYFISGFTLFMGRTGRFDTWYKRRIRRIYPSVFGWAIVAFIFELSVLSIDTIIKGGGEFITYIMIFYFILYFIKKYAMNKLNEVFMVCSIIVILWYIFFFPEKQDVLMYKRLMRWPCYFMFMLFGAMIGKSSIYKSQDIATNEKCRIEGLKNVLMFLISLVLFYGIQIFGKKFEIVSYFQIVTLVPLFGIVYYIYKIANSKILLKMCSNKYLNKVILVIGGLCLEIYLVQMPMLIGGVLPFGASRDALQTLFPLNIFVLLAIIIPMAYTTRSVGRFILQTFDSRDGYNWKNILKLYA